MMRRFFQMQCMKNIEYKVRGRIRQYETGWTL